MFLGILLYVAATAAIVMTGVEPTRLKHVLWLTASSLVSVLYSANGARTPRAGAWHPDARARRRPFYFGALQPILAALSSSLVPLTDGWHESRRPHKSAVRNIVPIISSVTALVVTPRASLLTRSDRQAGGRIWRSFDVSTTDADDAFHLVPRSLVDRFAFATVLIGIAAFVTGVLSAGVAASFAAPLAVVGLLAVIGGGVWRVVRDRRLGRRAVAARSAPQESVVAAGVNPRGMLRAG